MITKDKIKRLLRDLEADNVERTISTTDTDKFCKAICAFANDMPGKGEPGYLFIGAEVQSALEKNGNPPARFIIDRPNYFLAIVKEASS